MTDSDQCGYAGCKNDPDVERTMVLTGEERQFFEDHDPKKDVALQDLWE